MLGNNQKAAIVDRCFSYSSWNSRNASLSESANDFSLCIEYRELFKVDQVFALLRVTFSENCHSAHNIATRSIHQGFQCVQ